MTKTVTVAPVRKDLRVNVTPERAFEIFTAGMVRWWSRQYSINRSPIKDSVIEVEWMIGETRTVKHFYTPDSDLPDRTMVGMVAELTEMVNSVREGRPPSITGQDGRAGLAAVLAVYRSAETGTWVEVG